MVTKLNNTPRLELEYRTPAEVFNGMKQVNEVKRYSSDFHPFGIPVYVLNERLQGNNRIQKLEQRVKVGVYLGQPKNILLMYPMS